MVVNQAMAKRKSVVRRERGPAWHRSSTRSAILEAARDLITRDGIENTSLMRVAETAGFAPPTVYAYFVRKVDLISAIVADDLAKFARAIRSDFPLSAIEDTKTLEPASDASLEENVSSVATDAEAASESVGPNAPEPPDGLGAVLAAEMLHAEEEPDVDPEIDLLHSPAEPVSSDSIENSDSNKYADEASPDAAVIHPEESDVAPEAAEVNSHDSVAAAPEEAVVPAKDNANAAAPVEASPSESSFETRLAQLEARRVDPWLERRLREFERMLAALEDRVGTAEKNNVDGSAPIESRLQELFERFEGWEQKNAAAIAESANATAEKLNAHQVQQRQDWTELRTLTLETSGRLEVLERERELRVLAAEMPNAQHLQQRQDWTDLRTLTLDTSGRLEVLEHDRELRALAEEMPKIDFVPAVGAPEKPKRESESDESAAAAPQADASYIAAARRAALTAQSMANSDEGGFAREASAWMAPGRTRTRILLALCAGLAVIVITAGVLLHGRASAPAQMAAATVIPPHGKHLTRSFRAGDFSQALAAALGGDVHAQSAIGLAYLNGAGVSQDDTGAARWLSAAATSGEPVAQYWLATLFEHGKGEPTNSVEALRWYEASALQGNLKAMYKLAVSYAEGWGARQNYSEAARWFSRAAELGFVNAQYNLGVLYERGLGVPQSLLDAYKWYALAASQGDKDSANRVEALSSQLSAEDLASAREAVAAFKPQARNTAANVAPAVVTAKAPAAAAAKPTKS